MENLHKLALETIQLNKQAIIFAPSRASAEKTAEDLSALTCLQYPELEQQILAAISTPTKQCRRLARCIKKSIAFHHAGLTNKQKDLIEEEFKSGKIKIICATPTLAAGLSLPAFRVFIKSLKRFSGSWGTDWIPVLEYLQMAGRAGRPEYESFGEAIVFAKDEQEKEEIYQRYICGAPEDIYSKLAVEPVLRTYLLSLISSGIIRDQETMLAFFRKTFWAQQFQDLPKLEEILDRMLVLLKEWEFIQTREEQTEEITDESTTNLFVTAKTISKNPPPRKVAELLAAKKKESKFQPTLVGKRISQLYLDPLTAQHLLKCLTNFDRKKTAFSLLQMVSQTLEMRPLLKVKSKEQEEILEELSKNSDLFLIPEPASFDLEYPEFLDSVKTALFFEAWINEKEEDFLLDKYGIRPGEIRVKLESADWLLYASEELAKINNLKEVTQELAKLRLRIKDGVKEELLVLLKLKNIGRIRARKLFSNGIKNVGDLKKADLTSLSQMLGKKIAEDVKKQVGEEVKEIPQGTRKGQLSLLKYT